MKKAEAAKYLKIGERSLERYTSAGEITATRTRPPEGGQWFLDYPPEELDRFKREVLGSDVEAVKASPPTGEGSPPSSGEASPSSIAANSVALATFAETVSGVEVGSAEGERMAVFASLIGAAISEHQAKQKPRVAIENKALLTLQEAHEITGYSLPKLKAAFDAKELRGHRDGRVRRVRRVDLDSWLEGLTTG